MKKAPNFSLYDEESNPHALSDYKGHKVVLYFYPKDMTSGCTLEAQGFRDLWLEFVALDVHIFGISPDNVASHKKFCQKELLTFPLLADTDHKVAEAYGAWSGKISRNTVLIDEKGNIIKTFEKVDPARHPQELLEYIKNL